MKTQQIFRKHHYAEAEKNSNEGEMGRLLIRKKQRH